MAAQGQSFFQASGDSDAYTGSQFWIPSHSSVPVGQHEHHLRGRDNFDDDRLRQRVELGNGLELQRDQRLCQLGSGGGISAYYKIP